MTSLKGGYAREYLHGRRWRLNDLRFLYGYGLKSEIIFTFLQGRNELETRTAGAQKNRRTDVGSEGETVTGEEDSEEMNVA